jgi:hypothetical protein
MREFYCETLTSHSPEHHRAASSARSSWFIAGARIAGVIELVHHWGTR